MNKTGLQKMVGQLLVCGFDGITPSDEIKELIRDHKIGGIILFARNIGDANEVLRLTTELQLIAKQAGHERPLLICVDQENGVVRRLGTGTTVFPGAMLLGATGKTENAYMVGVATGTELKALGINWNLAPVVDVNNNPRNPVIGVRSYSEDPVTVANFAREAIRGMRQAGIITTLKHFPGHGDTDVDSHLNLPTVPYDMERLDKVELVPYRELIREGVDTVMTAHIYFPSIEKSGCIPATLSRNVVTGLLRQKLGYSGVITTDCMEMNAVRNTIGTINGSVAAIKAGIDLVMISHTYELQKGAIEAIITGVTKGGISEAEIESAYNRVQALKDLYLSWEDIQNDLGSLQLSDAVGGRSHKKLAQEIYRQGVTLYRNESAVIPVSNAQSGKVLVIYPTGVNISQVEDVQYSSCSLGKAVKEIHPYAQEFAVSNSPNTEEVINALEMSGRYDTIIVGTMSAVQNPEQVNLIKSLLKSEKKVIVVAMKSPYDISCFRGVSAYIATYEYTYSALCAAARLIFGLDEAKGKMPVTIL